jgi:hypothetical protein
MINDTYESDEECDDKKGIDELKVSYPIIEQFVGYVGRKSSRIRTSRDCSSSVWCEKGHSDGMGASIFVLSLIIA